MHEIINHELIEIIGLGGQAEVWKARQNDLDRIVAVKILSGTMAHNQQYVKRFLREARAIAKLKHPNIVSIYNVGEGEGFYFFTMQFLPGPSLAELVETSKALPQSQVVGFGIDIASGLDFAHKAGIIHRDIKPSNILLDANKRAVITDFGIAQMADETKLTQTGFSVGTPHYISPEQVRGKTVDNRSDIYSFGVLLFQLAVGKLPFEAEDTIALGLKHVSELPAEPIEINPSISPELNYIVLKCLEKEPADRYQRTTDLLADLEKVQSGLALPIEKKKRTRIITAFDQQIVNDEVQKRKRKYSIISMATILLIMLASTLIFFQYKQREKKLIEDKESIAKRESQLGQDLKEKQRYLQEQKEKEERLLAQLKDKNSREEYFQTALSEIEYLAKNRNFPAAEAKAQSLLEIDPANETVQSKLKEIMIMAEQYRRLTQQEEFQRGWSTLEQQVSNRNFSEALQLVDTLRAQYPDKDALLTEKQKEIQNAQNQAQREQQKQRDIEEYKKWAEDFFTQGDYSKALASYKKYFSLTSNVEPILDKGEKLLLQSNFEWAERFFSSAVELDSTNLKAVKHLEQSKLIRELETQIYIPPGIAHVGADNSASYRKYAKINLHGFWMDKYEVTNLQYQRFIRATGYPVPVGWNNDQFPPGMGKNPVVNVSKEDAEAYAKWVKKRLPSDEEWDRAARGDQGLIYPWGNDFNRDFVIVNQASSATVGSRPPGASPFGVMDMIGNVYEWTRNGLVRGGGFTSPAIANVLRSFNVFTKSTGPDVGFRCVKD